MGLIAGQAPITTAQGDASPSSTARDWRLWTDASTGKEIEARVVSIDGSKALLQRKVDGAEFEVSWRRFVAEDQAYLEGVSSGAEFPIRIWTLNGSGRRAEAKFVSQSGNHVLLEGADGRQATLSASDLSQLDQAYLAGIASRANNPLDKSGANEAAQRPQEAPSRFEHVRKREASNRQAQRLPDAWARLKSAARFVAQQAIRGEPKVLIPLLCLWGCAGAFSALFAKSLGRSAVGWLLLGMATCGLSVFLAPFLAAPWRPSCDNDALGWRRTIALISGIVGLIALLTVVATGIAPDHFDLPTTGHLGLRPADVRACALIGGAFVLWTLSFAATVALAHAMGRSPKSWALLSLLLPHVSAATLAFADARFRSTSGWSLDKRLLFRLVHLVMGCVAVLGLAWFVVALSLERIAWADVLQNRLLLVGVGAGLAATAVLCAVLAKLLGRSSLSWGLGALLLPPITPILLAVAFERPVPLKRCPNCRKRQRNTSPPFVYGDMLAAGCRCNKSWAYAFLYKSQGQWKGCDDEPDRSIAVRIEPSGTLLQDRETKEAVAMLASDGSLTRLDGFFRKPQSAETPLRRQRAKVSSPTTPVGKSTTTSPVAKNVSPTSRKTKRSESQLIAELIEIGRNIPNRDYGSSGYLYKDSQGNHTRSPEAREIGQQLHDIGGMKKMLEAHAEVAKALGALPARELEACWGGVGEWLA